MIFLPHLSTLNLVWAGARSLGDILWQCLCLVSLRWYEAGLWLVAGLNTGLWLVRGLAAGQHWQVTVQALQQQRHRRTEVIMQHSSFQPPHHLTDITHILALTSSIRGICYECTYVFSQTLLHQSLNVRISLLSHTKTWHSQPKNVSEFECTRWSDR